MKKIICFIILFSACGIYAASVPEGLSVHLSTGYNPNGMGLTRFMDNPPPANTTLGFPTVFSDKLYGPMSDFDNIDNFRSTETENTWSTGSILSAGLRWDFMKVLFLKTEFTYDTNWYLPMIYKAKFKYLSPGAPAEGAEVTYKFSYESIAVPLVFGLNIPVQYNGAYSSDIYIGAGAVWTLTKYMFSIDAPYGYLTDGTSGQAAFKEELEFSAMTFGYVWMIGFDHRIMKNMNFFIEINSYIYSPVSAEAKFQSNTLISNTTGKTSTIMDFSHTAAKIGISYKFSGITDYFF